MITPTGADPPTLPDLTYVDQSDDLSETRHDDWQYHPGYPRIPHIGVP